MSIIKCCVKKYDPATPEPPHQFIVLGTIEVDKPLVDNSGVQLSINIQEACKAEGHEFRFMSRSSHDDCELDVIVRGELEDLLDII